MVSHITHIQAAEEAASKFEKSNIEPLRNQLSAITESSDWKKGMTLVDNAATEPNTIKAMLIRRHSRIYLDALEDNVNEVKTKVKILEREKYELYWNIFLETSQ